MLYADEVRFIFFLWATPAVDLNIRVIILAKIPSRFRNQLPWWPAAPRLIIYLILVLTPVVTEALYNLDAKDQFPYNLGRLFAVTAFTVIFLQAAPAARLKSVQRPFGLNLTFPFHRRMGICAALPLLSHPILLIIGGGGRK